jgi:hypothetical protein
MLYLVNAITCFWQLKCHEKDFTTHLALVESPRMRLIAELDDAGASQTHPVCSPPLLTAQPDAIPIQTVLKGRSV